MMSCFKKLDVKVLLVQKKCIHALYYKDKLFCKNSKKTSRGIMYYDIYYYTYFQYNFHNIIMIFYDLSIIVIAIHQTALPGVRLN